MKRWGFVPLAISAFAAFAMSVNAADAPVYKAYKAPPPPDFGNIYFGVDLTSHGGLVGYAGILYAPYGMDVSGIRLALFGLYGQYKYDGGGVGITGTFGSFDALIGYSFVMQNGALTLSVGPNFQDHSLSPADPTNPVQGSKVGLKVQADIWANPTPNTLIYALGSYSTAFETYYALGRFGFDLTNGQGVFLGPEIGVLGNERTDQVRAGVFISGIRAGRSARLGFSTGWLRERDQGSGWYGTANIDFSF
jgi:hypothetical protein